MTFNLPSVVSKCWWVPIQLACGGAFQVLENLESLTSLQSLFVGKNKIAKLQGLDALVNLRTLSIQVRDHWSTFVDLAWGMAWYRLLVYCVEVC